jgi:hypothetical protein
MYPVITMSKALMHQREIKFNVVLPQSTIEASDTDLRLSLITLKNLESVVAVHTSKIERELKKRGVSKYIIHQQRDTM